MTQSPFITRNLLFTEDSSLTIFHHSNFLIWTVEVNHFENEFRCLSSTRASTTNHMCIKYFLTGKSNLCECSTCTYTIRIVKRSRWAPLSAHRTAKCRYTESIINRDEWVVGAKRFTQVPDKPEHRRGQWSPLSRAPCTTGRMSPQWHKRGVWSLFWGD